jgi:thymidylate synthase
MLKRYNERRDECYTTDISLSLNPEKTNFYDITIDDFVLNNYQPNKPQLKLELGI